MAVLQYFSPSNMPELALPYPKDLFLHRENSALYFQWSIRLASNLVRLW
jgi:hypothetical protein